MSSGLFRVVCVMRPSIDMLCLGMAVQAKYFHDSIPDRLALEEFSHRNTLNMRGVRTVKRANNFSELSQVAHDFSPKVEQSNSILTRRLRPLTASAKLPNAEQRFFKTFNSVVPIAKPLWAEQCEHCPANLSMLKEPSSPMGMRCTNPQCLHSKLSAMKSEGSIVHFLSNVISAPKLLSRQDQLRSMSS